MRLCFGHIVNHREPKGSRFVLDAVHKARMDGADFKFLFAERFEHEAALQLYEKIDVLLEQFVIGWYGLQACEFALMEKPVVVWLNREDGPPLVPQNLWDEIPFINSSAWDLPETIKRICRMDAHELKEIGRRGKAFVEKWHSDKAIAEQMLRDLGVKGGEND
jgi:hypothetical protein